MGDNVKYACFQDEVLLSLGLEVETVGQLGDSRKGNSVFHIERLLEQKIMLFRRFYMVIDSQ